MKINVCIVTLPLGEAGYTPLSNLVNLLSRLANKVYVVSGGAALEKLENSKLDTDVQAIKVIHRVSSKLLMRIINHLRTQLKIMRYMIGVSGDTDLFIFSIGGEELVLPLLLLKFSRKKVLLMPGGAATRVSSLKKDPLSIFISLLATINFSLADRIIVYSPALVRELDIGLGRVVVAHRHLVDFTKFAVKKKISERVNVVGYIGRLSEEKGILNLIEAIPLVLKERADTHFMICGEGSLASKVEKIVKGLEADVKLMGWIPHEDVPQYLNKLKLLVLPSFTEGLPNIVLEAMACGTPVLATPVGAVPDIIKDGVTGFLLRSNDPEHIADRIVELLDKPKLLEKVSTNAYNYVRENFSYEKVLETWRRFISKLKVGGERNE